MRFLSGTGRKNLLYGRLLKIYDRRYCDIWNRRPQLDARVSWRHCALGTGCTEGSINRRCPNFLQRVSELGLHRAGGTGPFP